MPTRLSSRFSVVIHLFVVLSLTIPNSTSFAFSDNNSSAGNINLKAENFQDLDPTMEPTESPTPTQAEIPEPREELTLTPTIQESPMLVEATPTVMPTITITATTAITATPTLTVPLATPTPPIAVLSLPDSVSLSLLSSNTYVSPGETITITWELPAVEEKFLAVDFFLSVPPGLTPLNQALKIVEDERLLKTSISEKSGMIVFTADATIDNTLVFIGWIEKDGVQIAFQRIEMKPKWNTEIDPGGGEATAFNGRVKVKFPDGAADESLDVVINLPLDGSTPYYLSNTPLEVQAFSKEDKTSVTKFEEPIAIEIGYSDAQVHGDESTLTLFYFDEQINAWRPLPTQVFSDTNTLVGFTDHFSVFDFDTQDWEAARLPSMSNFQVSDFSGAASYSFPIEVPPGPGGLQPQLALTYNSQVVDNADSLTQASWVGMGWSLDTGYIQRNMKGTPTYYDDDTFTIVINGAASLLLPITDQDGNPNTTDYRMAEDKFWRVRHFMSSGGVRGWSGDTSYWQVWDKEGNQYFFETHAWYPAFPYCTAPYMQTWQWSLSRVRNIFGQQLTYTYSSDLRNKYYPDCAWASVGADISVYPNEILYANNRYKVKFVLTSRLDFNIVWDDHNSYTLYSPQRLSEIHILHDSDGNGSFEQLIRKYVLSYTNQAIMPGVTWRPDWVGTIGYTAALTSIREYGLNGAGPLPATIFTYGDQMHLTQADNGYGGQVSYTYDDMPWYEIGSTEDGLYISEGNVAPGDTDMFVTAGNLPIYHPGRAYLIKAVVLDNWVPVGPYINMTFGLYDQSGRHPGTQIDRVYEVIEDWRISTFTSVVRLNTGSNSTRFFYSCDNVDVCIVYYYYAWPVVTRYRVITRRLTDLVTGEYSEFAYNYDEPATNDTRHSEAANASTHYTKVQSEFRGHGMVQELDPGGKVTTSYYAQDDGKKGKAQTIITSNQEYWDSFDYINSSKWTLVNNDTQAAIRLDGDNALRVTNGPDWSAYVMRSEGDTLENGDAVLLQFLLTGTSTAAAIALEDGTYLQDTFRRWGLYIKSDHTVVVQFHDGLSFAAPTNGFLEYPLGFTVQENIWYNVLLIVDDQSLQARIWPKDNPASVGRKEIGTPDRLKQRSWRFIEKTNNGTVWLDSYSEGKIYSLSDNLYTSANDSATLDVNALPWDTSTNQRFSELKIYWTRLVRSKVLNFEGGASFVSGQQEYDYDVAYQGGVKQYGNLVHTYDFYWDGVAYVRYRVTRSVYFPAEDSVKYLVGLLAFQNSFSCPAGVCDFENQDLLSSFGYVYDSNSYSSTPPTVGKISLYRKQVRWAGAYTDHRYLDIRYAYDYWGNITNTTVYPDEGGFGITHTLKPATTTTLYDSSYHTYPVLEINPLGQATYWSYNYVYGVPASETTSNGATTTASYDSYGRLTKLVRPYDSESSPSLQISYILPTTPISNNPFFTQVTQKIDENKNLVVRKFYNGLGQLLQMQTVNATVGAASKDILIDYYYDSAGRMEKQSVPYDIFPTAGFQGRATNQPYTLTLYDVLNRVTSVTGTDGLVQSSTTYSIGYDLLDGKYYQKTCTQDELSQETCSYSDAFGNILKVDPAVGPTVVYTYDDLDRMKSAQYGISAPATINYDLGSRKTNMSDPDMGFWSYGYDPQGKLLWQTDARGCTTNIGYDLANRITGKNYSGTACGSTVGVGYSYETPGRLDSFDGSSLPAGWTQTSGASVSGGSLHITGISTWDRYVRRSEAQSAGLSASFLFKVNSTTGWAQMYFDSGTRLTSDYRRLGINVQGASIYRQTYDGPPPSNNVYMMPVRASIWYEARLSLDINGLFTVQVWEKDNPSVYAESSVQTTNWGGRSWTFQDEVYSGVQDLDEYSEVRGMGVDQAMSMTDGSGSTTWDFDLLGRITREDKAINNPDGGNFSMQWSYNSAGLPKTMTYPDGEVITYSYHNQALVNSLSSSSSTFAVINTYYDAAGRFQYQKLDGDGVTLTRDFNYFDWTTTNGVGRLQHINNSIVGQGDITHHQSLSYTYTAVGNMHTISDYINGSPQTQTFSYDAGNRLTSAQAVGGTNGTYGPESYSYDPGSGNLASKAGVSYTYNPQVTCPAGTRTLPHAVSVAGSNTYNYDCNGNMTQRNLGSSHYDLIYDAENRLTEVRSTGDVIFSDMFESGDLSAWSSSQTDGGDLSVTTSAAMHGTYGLQGVIDDSMVIAARDDRPNNEKEYWARFYFNRNNLVIDPTKAINIFKTFTDANTGVYAVRVIRDAGGSYKLFLLITLDNAATVQTVYVDSNVAPTAIEVHWKASSAPGANNGIIEWWIDGVQQTGLTGLDTDTLEVDYVRLGPQGSISTARGTVYLDSFISRRSFYQGLGNDLTVTSDQFTYDGDGNRVKASVNGATTVYIGNFFEKSGTNIKKYYYAGSTRVAMNDNGVVKYLFGDHLGSTNVVVNADGSGAITELYKPWGESRYSSGSLPTTFKYTGQRQESSVAGGLYYYNARWYDSYLNRWLQPDTIIPQNQGTQAWDRYAYSNNNPVNYTDPTGHCISILKCLDDSDYKENDKQIISNFKKEHASRGSTVFWAGLSKVQQQIFEEAGWWEGAFNDAMNPQTSPAEGIYDPLNILETFVLGRGIIKIASPWLIQPVSNIPTNQVPNLSDIIDDIENWVGQGEKPIAFPNKAGDFIMRNAENTRRFQAHFNNYYPHSGPHFHLDYLDELGEWIKFRIFPP